MSECMSKGVGKSGTNEENGCAMHDSGSACVDAQAAQ